MHYAYYPGCSLKGSAKKLDRDLRRVFEILGIKLTEIENWKCCGAFEYGSLKQIREMSKVNLKKAERISFQLIAACPLCCKNLKEANEDKKYSIYHPLEILNVDVLFAKAKRELRGLPFTPYYGCLLLRPKETAIKDPYVMERVIDKFGGSLSGEKIRDRCCGGNRFFVDKELSLELTRTILAKSRGFLVVFCPLCHMVLRTFSERNKVIYFTELLLYLMGEREKL